MASVQSNLSPKSQPLRRPGRPDLAARVWQHRGMRHALVKLYLYSNLSTEDISRVITALAKQHVDARSCTGKRSTQVELRRLLSENGGKLDRRLRPASREAARERAAWLRMVRNRRAHKSHVRIFQLPESRGRQARTSISEDYFEADSGYTQLLHHDHSIGQPVAGEAGFPKTSIGSTNDSSLSTGTEVEHKHVRLSWVRQLLPEIGGARPTSSLYLEIRSLLSLRSVRSSWVSSRDSLTSFSTDPSMSNEKEETDGPEISMQIILNPLTSSLSSLSAEEKVHQYNVLIARLCCSRKKVCQHRRLATAIKQGIPITVINTERNIFNETPLHTAARWKVATQEMTWLIKNSGPETLNATNIAGETFMHILVREWFLARPTDLFCLMIAGKNQGFDFGACRYKDQGPFSTLLVGVDARSPSLETEKRNQLCLGFEAVMRLPRDSVQEWLKIQSPRGCSLGHQAIEFLDSLAVYSRDSSTMNRCLCIYRQYQTKMANIVWQIDSYVETPSTESHWLHNRVETLSDGNVFSVAEFRQFITNGGDINKYNQNYMTCLTAVIDRIYKGQLTEPTGAKIVSLFLKFGGDPALVDGFGNTPLHDAANLGLCEIFDVLMSGGADITALNAAGQTTLDYAIGVKTRRRSSLGQFKKTCPRVQKILVHISDVISKRQDQNQNQPRDMKWAAGFDEGD